MNTNYPDVCLTHQFVILVNVLFGEGAEVSGRR